MSIWLQTVNGWATEASDFKRLPEDKRYILPNGQKIYPNMMKEVRKNGKVIQWDIKMNNGKTATIYND